MASLELKKRFNRDKTDWVWHYGGTINDERLRGSTGTKDRKRAEQLAAQIEAKAWTAKLDGPSSVVTFFAAAESYLTANPKLSETSRYFLGRVVTYWGETPLKDITPGAVREAALVLQPDSCNATKNRQVLTPTKTVVNHAADLGKCPPLRVKPYAEEKREKRHASQAWIEAFMAHASSPELAALACFMFWTAARIGEALRVTWQDIDLDARTVLIRQTKRKGGGFDERTAYLPDPLHACLTALPGRDGLVFGYAHRYSVRTAWETTIRHAGIMRLTPHAGRHGFATTLTHLGIDAKTIAKWGGWKSAAMVHEVYGHAREDRAEVMEQIARRQVRPALALPVPVADSIKIGTPLARRPAVTRPKRRKSAA